MANGWWNLDGAITSCVAAYQPIGAASYAASKSNLFNPGTLDAIDGAAYPTWESATGWSFLAASSQYLATGITTSTLYSYLILFTNAASGVYTMFGTDAHRLMPNRNNLVYYANTTKAPGMTSGVLALAGITGYRNGVAEATVGETTSRAALIGAQNNETGAVAFWTGNIQAVAIFSAVLTAEQVAALTNAMNALTVVTDDLTAADFTLSPVTFDTPTLVNVSGAIDLTAINFMLAAVTFDAPALAITWNTPACRSFAIESESRNYTIESESRTFVIPAEDRGLKITSDSEAKYAATRSTYNGLTGKDLTLSVPTFDAPKLNLDWWLASDIPASNCIAAYQAIGANNYSDSLVNLANPGTNNLTYDLAPLFSPDTGWHFTGVQYLNTGITPADEYSMIVMYSDVSNNAAIAGALVSSPSSLFEVNPYYTSTSSRFMYGDKSVVYNTALPDGVIALTKNYGYFDGLPVVTVPEYTWNTNNREIYIGARSAYPSITAVVGRVHAVAFYKTTLTDIQILAVTNAMKAIEAGNGTVYFNDDFVPGIWSWYTKPTYVYKNSKHYFTVIDTLNTDLNVHSYDPDTDTLVSHTLNGLYGSDDHSTASILFRDSDGKILAFGATHNAQTINLWESQNAGDVSAWENEVSLDSQIGGGTYNYPIPIQLTGEENDPIYLFYNERGTGIEGEYYSKSVDGGATWSAGTRLFMNGTERPYFQISKNGTDRIDFACMQGHPNEVVGCSIYHFYYTGGKYYKSDGTEIDKSLPLEPSDITQVYDGSSAEACIWETAIDSSGYPVIVFATFPTNTDGRYYYARWNGSSWDVNQVCDGGRSFVSTEVMYSGGITLDKGNPNNVWCSRLYDGRFEIFKYTTADGGANFTGTQITSDSNYINGRPVCAEGAVNSSPLYWEGVYITYANTDCYVRFRT